VVSGGELVAAVVVLGGEAKKVKMKEEASFFPLVTYSEQRCCCMGPLHMSYEFPDCCISVVRQTVRS
jgi:hypothetical protein